MNELKYKIEIWDGEAKIINRDTGVAIPDNEPIFILRAKDRKALAALSHYCGLVDTLDMKQSVRESIGAFRGFQEMNPGLMHEPD